MNVSQFFHHKKAQAAQEPVNQKVAAKFLSCSMYNEKKITKLFTALAEKITGKQFSIQVQVNPPCQIKSQDSALLLSIPGVSVPEKTEHTAAMGTILVVGATATVASALALATGTTLGVVFAVAAAGAGVYSCLRMLNKERPRWKSIINPMLSEIVGELKGKFLPAVQNSKPEIPLKLTVQFKEREEPLNFVERDEIFHTIIMPYIKPLSPDEKLLMDKIYLG